MAVDVYIYDKTQSATYTDFATWVASIATNKSIIIATDTEITGTVVVPSNIDIVGFYNGAKFTGTGTLTINKMSCDPQHQIFDSTLTVVLNKSIARPEWFGGSIQRATNSLTSGTVELSHGTTYTTSVSIIPKANVGYRGYGKTTVVQGTANNLKVFDCNDTIIKDGIFFKDFKIINTGNTSTVESSHCINLFDTINAVVSGMYFENTIGDGCYIRNSTNVLVENCFCNNTRRQGIAVTLATGVTIRHIRGTGSMINLVDIEPNSGDTVTDVTIDDISFDSTTIAALRMLYRGVDLNPAAMSNVKISNISSRTLNFSGITNFVANNLNILSGAAYNSLELYLMVNAELNNVNISGTDTTNSRLKITDVDNVAINNINIVGGSSVDCDLLDTKSIKISNINLLSVGDIGIRSRNHEDFCVNNATIEDANTYVFMFTPTTTSTKTKLNGFVTKNCGTGIYCGAGAGDVYVDGDLTGCITAVDTAAGYTDKIYYSLKTINLFGTSAGDLGLGTASPISAPGWTGPIFNINGANPVLSMSGAAGNIDGNVALDSTGLYIDVSGSDSLANNKLVIRTSAASSDSPSNRVVIDSNGVSISGYIYLYGSELVDGSLRIGATSTQRLTQKRISGNWTTIESMDY